jgi:lipopolysaccharide transport system permease protein
MPSLPEVSSPPWRRYERRRGLPSLSRLASDVWAARELLLTLVTRDLQVRYKQTVLGVLWIFLQPLASAVVVTLVFGNVIGFRAGLPAGVSFASFVLAALLPWQFISSAVTTGGTALLANQPLVTKAAFPRVLLPLAAVCCSLVDLAIVFLPISAFLVIAGHSPHPPNIPLLVVSLAVAVGLALALAIWLSALTVEYRDVRYALPFVVQIWFLASPIAYPGGVALASLGNGASLVFKANPVYFVAEGARSGLLGVPSPDAFSSAMAIAGTIVLLVTGIIYFLRVERAFADVI